MYVDLLCVIFDIWYMDKDTVLIDFGNKIRELRMKKGWSQEDLAFETGFHRTYIGMIERGERNPSLKSIVKFSEAFEVRVKALFT